MDKSGTLLILVAFSVFSILAASSTSAQVSLSCAVRTPNCQGGEVAILEMTGNTNAHGALPGQGGVQYTYKVCCGLGGLAFSNTCTDTYDVALRLSNTTNAHAAHDATAYPAEYSDRICLSSTSLQVPTVDCSNTVVAGSCPTNYQCIASLSDATGENSHLGDCSAYNSKICCQILADITTPTTTDNSIDNIWFTAPQNINLTCADTGPASTGCQVTRYCTQAIGTCDPISNGQPATVIDYDYPLPGDFVSSVTVSSTEKIFYYSIDNAANQEDVMESHFVQICSLSTADITPQCGGGIPSVCEEGETLQITTNYSDGCPEQQLTGTDTVIEAYAQSTNPECILPVNTTCTSDKVTCNGGSCVCVGDYVFGDLNNTICAGKTMLISNVTITENSVIPIETITIPTVQFETGGERADLQINYGAPYSVYRNVTGNINVTFIFGIDSCEINWMDGLSDQICDSNNGSITDCPGPGVPLIQNVSHTYDSDGYKEARLICSLTGGGNVTSISNSIFIDTFAPIVNPPDQGPTSDLSPTILTGLFDVYPSSNFTDPYGFCVAEGGTLSDGTQASWFCETDPITSMIPTCDLISGALQEGIHNMNITCNDNAGAWNNSRASVMGSFRLFVDRSFPICNLDLALNNPPYHTGILPISWSSPSDQLEFYLKYTPGDNWSQGGDTAEIDGWDEFNTPPGLFNPPQTNPVPPSNTSTVFGPATGTYWFACKLTDMNNITGRWTYPHQAIMDNTEPLAELNTLPVYVGRTINTVSWYNTSYPISGIRGYNVQYNTSQGWVDWLIETPALYGIFGNGNPIYLQDNTEYCFRVSMTSNSMVTGNWSSSIKCTTADLAASDTAINVTNQFSTELVNESMLPFIIAGPETTSINIKSFSSDSLSGIQAHILTLVDTGQLGSCLPDNSQCSLTGIGFDFVDSLDFSVQVIDNVGNVFYRLYTVVSSALANFAVNKITLTLGESYDVAVKVRNLQTQPDTITLDISPENPGYFVATFLENDNETIQVTLQPHQQKTVIIRLIATDVTDPTGETLNLSATSILGNPESDELKVVVMFPATFPGLATPGIILILALSVLIYAGGFSSKTRTHTKKDKL